MADNARKSLPRCKDMCIIYKVRSTKRKPIIHDKRLSFHGKYTKTACKPWAQVESKNPFTLYLTFGCPYGQFPHSDKVSIPKRFFCFSRVSISSRRMIICTSVPRIFEGQIGTPGDHDCTQCARTVCIDCGLLTFQDLEIRS